MQDIYIDSVRIENVRSHAEMEMDFPVDNFTVIVGKIGAGKSTIFKSVSMALYGDDGGKKGERLSLTDMLPEKNPKNLAIFLKARIIENDITDKYEIKLYQNHSKFKNSLYLLKTTTDAAGVETTTDISGETKTATYELISQLFIPRDVYHNTVYFTQQVKDFFTALSNAEQKDIFDAILSMQVYDTYYKNTDDRLKKLFAQLQDLNNEMSILITKQSLKTTVKTDILSRKDEAEKAHALKLDGLKTRKINTENKIELINMQLEDVADSETEYDAVVQKLNKQDAQRGLIVQQNSDKKAQIESEFAAKLHTEIMSLEMAKNEDIRISESHLSEKSNTINARLVVIAKQRHEISDKYNTAIIEKEINGYKSEKQKEIDTVKQMISDLDAEYPIDNEQTQLENRKKFFIDAIDKVKAKAEELRSSAKVIQNSITSLTAIVTEDEESLNQPVSVCSKCMRPFEGSSSSAAIRDGITINKQKILEYNSEIERLKQEMSKIKTEHDDYQVQRDLEIKNIQERIALILDKKNRKQEDLNRKLILLREEISEHVAELNAKIDQLNTLHNKEALQLITENDNLNSELRSILNQIRDNKIRINNQFEIDTQKIKQEHKLNCMTAILSATEYYNKSLEKIDKVIEELIRSKNTLHSLVLSRNEMKNELIRFKADLVNITDTIKVAEMEVVFDEDQIHRIDNELKEINENINSLGITKSGLDKEITMLEFWKVAFSDSGIKSMLIDVAIPFMNESVSECLEMAAPGVFTVTFDTLKTTKSGEMKDKFNVNIRHNIKGTSSHKKLSGGEKRLVDIACMHALRGLTEKLYGKRFHNIFYDEVLDALDEDTAEIFCQMSKVMARDKNISLITHKLLDHVEPDRCFTIGDR